MADKKAQGARQQRKTTMIDGYDSDSTYRPVGEVRLRRTEQYGLSDRGEKHENDGSQDGDGPVDVREQVVADVINQLAGLLAQMEQQQALDRTEMAKARAEIAKQQAANLEMIISNRQRTWTS